MSSALNCHSKNLMVDDLLAELADKADQPIKGDCGAR
jgi:hypothetical protein